MKKSMLRLHKSLNAIETQSMIQAGVVFGLISSIPYWVIALAL